jgi:Tfp pilus assembly protein PilV
MNKQSSLRGEDGVTMVEVLVSMLLVGLIALSFTGLDAAGRSSADQRRVAQANAIAQQDQERLRALSADQLATLNETRTVTLDSNTYTVESTGKYQSGAGTGADSCASTTSAADYARVTSTVTWDANRRSDVKLQSLITPRVGGSLVVQAINQGATALAGVTVTATGNDEDTSGVVRSGKTDDGGCVIFGSLPVGTYNVTATLTGYVDEKSNSAPTQAVTTTAGNSTNLTFKLGLPGMITNATFQAVAGSTTVNSQQSPGMSWNNTNMLTPGVTGSASTYASTFSTPNPASLFPFTTGTNVYTSNYQVWGGTCTAAQPPTGAGTGRTFVTVSPGTTVNAPVVKLPLLKLVVTYPNSSTNVRPSHVKFTDPCSTTRNLTPSSGVASSYNTTTGWLSNPGQIYGGYTSFCVDYNYTGTSYRKATLSGTFNNTSFTAVNTATFNLTTSSTSGQC